MVSLHKLGASARDWCLALLKLDGESDAALAAKGCPYCGGRLDRADFPRKPRGEPAAAADLFRQRFSRCCAECRRRATAPSVRFLDRRVYVGVTVILVSILGSGLNRRRAEHLRRLCGVSLSTLRRWRQWWLEGLPGLAVWRGAGAAGLPRRRVMPGMLRALLAQSRGGDLGQRLGALLEWLSGLSASKGLQEPAM